MPDYSNKKMIGRKLSTVLIALTVFIFSSCASVSDLPDRASDVSFVDHIAGAVSIREYDLCGYYLDADMKTMVEAAQYSLIKNKFKIREASLIKGVIRGEHGLSDRDWNIVAGAYFKELKKGVAVKIIVRTAVSTSLYKEEYGTAKQWADKIVSSMETYLQRDLKIRSSAVNCGSM